MKMSSGFGLAMVVALIVRVPVVVVEVTVAEEGHSFREGCALVKTLARRKMRYGGLDAVRRQRYEGRIIEG